MKTVLAQIKFKTADFEFNYNQIVKYAQNTTCDLIIFPQCDIEALGGKDLVYDEKACNKQMEFFENIAQNICDKALFIGNVLIYNDKVSISDDGFYNICGETVYVSDVYRDDIVCDLYILNKNKYFVMNAYREFVESINTNNDFMYVNALALTGSNVFAGGSFVKNKHNELILQFPLCEEVVRVVDFSKDAIELKEDTQSEIFKVLIFALREYCENTGFKQVLLGLSGGIDSALVAALATFALGPENVLGVLMPSMYSSQGSITDSVELAQNLGIKTIKHPITPLFENFMDKVVHEKTMDLAEENLQARLRALILMFFSNRENRLLLSTSNKSESAMGFGTLYGDLAGGLNLICDLTKTNVYKLVDYINRHNEIIPESIIKKAPSAELRPNQKDQDRLPEYAILDDIIELYLEQNAPRSVLYTKYGKELTEEVITKIYRYQFKRKQCCLGIRLTERSFAEGVDLPVTQGLY